MPVPQSSAARKNWMMAINEDNGAGLRKSINITLPTIQTASGNLDIYLMAPEDGILHSAELSALDGLAASDTNYLTFSMTNLGQSGTGTTEMLAATAENTTKVTGGAALTANSRRILKTATTPSALNVNAGDRIRFRSTGTGTLSNTVSGAVLLFRFNP